jgi:hypothetical protein
VPKYDAFGREIGEDTLAGLGGSEYAPRRESTADGWTDAQVAEAREDAEAAPAAPDRAEPAQAALEPAEAHRAFEPPAFGPPAKTVRVGRPGGAGCLVALVVLALIAAAPIVAIVSIVGSAGDAIDEVTDALDSVPDVPEDLDPAPAPPTGIAGASLIAPRNLESALERIRGMGGATLIRLAPERLDAQLVRGARQRSVQVTFEGSVSRGPATPGGSGLAKVPLSAIDPGAPVRLVRGSAARYRVRPRGINYLVLMPFPGEGHRWIAYFKNGVYVQGDRNGRVVRRIS